MKYKKTILGIIILIALLAVILFFQKGQEETVGGGIVDSPEYGGMVGYWSFNGQDVDWGSQTAYDRSGSGNDGTITNMSTSTSPVPGIVGQALKFDGSNDWIDPGKMGSFGSATSNGVTMITWLKTSDISRESIVGVVETNEMYIQWEKAVPVCDGTAVRFLIGDLSPDSRVYFDWNADTSNFYDGEWHHTAVTFNGSNSMSFYLDGTEISSCASVANSYVGKDLASHSLGIGTYNRYGIPQDYFTGTLDEVRIYNRALSAAEILTIYRDSAPEFRSKINVAELGKWEL